MAPPSEPQIDTKELMARVRATLGSSDAANDAGTATPIVLSPLHPAPDYEWLQGSEVAERLNRHFYGPRDYTLLGFKA